MKITTVQGVEEFFTEMNLDRDRSGEHVFRQTQLFNRWHVRLEFPLVRCLREAPDCRREWHPPRDETDAHPPDDIKMQSGDGGNRSPRATRSENGSSGVELPVLRDQTGSVHRCTGWGENG